jgi:hypothetical protein
MYLVDRGLVLHPQPLPAVRGHLVLITTTHHFRHLLPRIIPLSLLLRETWTLHRLLQHMREDHQSIFHPRITAALFDMVAQIQVALPHPQLCHIQHHLPICPVQPPRLSGLLSMDALGQIGARQAFSQ